MGPAASRFPSGPAGRGGAAVCSRSRDVLPPRTPRAHAPCAVSPGFPQEAGCGPGLPSPRATSRRSLTPPAPRILRALPVQVADTCPRPWLPLGHPAPTQALALTEGWAAGLRGGGAGAGAGRAISGGPRGPRHPRSETRTKGVTQRETKGLRVAAGGGGEAHRSRSVLGAAASRHAVPTRLSAPSAPWPRRPLRSGRPQTVPPGRRPAPLRWL